EVVMMGDGGELGLGDEVGDRHTQRNIHRDAQGILDDQNVERILLDEVVQRPLEERRQVENLGGQDRLPLESTEGPAVDVVDLRMPEERFGHDHAETGVPVRLATVPVADVAMIPEDLRPLET